MAWNIHILIYQSYGYHMGSKHPKIAYIPFKIT